MTQDVKHSSLHIEQDDKWPWKIRIEPVGLSFDRNSYSTSCKSLSDVMSGVAFKGQDREDAIDGNRNQIELLTFIVTACNSHYEFIEALTRISSFLSVFMDGIGADPQETKLKIKAKNKKGEKVTKEISVQEVLDMANNALAKVVS